MEPLGPMEPIANETWKSFVRSPRRKRLLILLSSLGEAYLGQLARLLGAPPHRVKALLHGRPPSYSEDLSLVELGLARERWTAQGRAYEITPKGRRKARSLAAGGRAGREKTRGTAAPAGEAPPAAPAAEVTGWSMTWRI